MDHTNLCTYDDLANVQGTGLLLFSGGFESALAALLLRESGLPLVALTINYKGRPCGEIRSVEQLSSRLGISRVLTASISLPTQFAPSPPAAYEGWFAYRNLLFFGIAAHVAQTHHLDFIAGGYEPSDGLIFDDSTPHFFATLSLLLDYSGYAEAPHRPTQLVLPLIGLDDDVLIQIIQDRRFADVLSLTWSCWRDGDTPCGRCASCTARQQFEEEYASAHDDSALRNGDP